MFSERYDTLRLLLQPNENKGLLTCDVK